MKRTLEAKRYTHELFEEINKDRENHGNKPLAGTRQRAGNGEKDGFCYRPGERRFPKWQAQESFFLRSAEDFDEEKNCLSVAFHGGIFPDSFFCHVEKAS